MYLTLTAANMVVYATAMLRSRVRLADQNKCSYDLQTFVDIGVLVFFM